MIQDSYAKLLSVLIPELESGRVPEALDEINLFWIRNIDVVQLYLKAMFSGNESYVFTAATFMDFDDKEHLPFLMIGEKHILDDPLNIQRYIIKFPIVMIWSIFITKFG